MRRTLRALLLALVLVAPLAVAATATAAHAPPSASQPLLGGPVTNGYPCYGGARVCSSVENIGSWGTVYAKAVCPGRYWDMALPPGASTGPGTRLPNADAVYVGAGQRVHRYIRVNGWVTQVKPDLHGPVVWCTSNVADRSVMIARF